MAQMHSPVWMKSVQKKCLLHPRPYLRPIFSLNFARASFLVGVEIVAHAQPEHPALAVQHVV